MTLHADAAALAQLQAGPAKVVAVKAEEYDDEFLSLDLNVKIIAILTMPSPIFVNTAHNTPMRS